MRHANLRVVAFGAVLVVSLSAFAQTKDAGAPKAAGAAGKGPTTTAAADAGSTAPAAAPTAGAPSTAAPTTASADGGGSAMIPAPANSAPAGMDGPTYAVRLRDLEARVDELKDQIRRSHTRL